MATVTCFVTASAAEQVTPAYTPTAHKASFILPSVTASRPALEGIARHLPAVSNNVLVFSAPPDETEAEANRIYKPIAEYLSRIIGKRIVYRHPSDWFTYQMEMQRGSYDLVFDGPQFNSWRIANLQHNMLVKIADANVFAVVVRKNDNRITDIKQLAGQKLCGMDPPNLGTLAVLNQFGNPARQPLIINTVGWTKAYEGVAFEKTCIAAIVPVANLKKFTNSDNFVRVVYQTKALPNQALSAGPRISVQDQAQIAAALMSPEGTAVVAPLLATNASNKGLTYASNGDYVGFDSYLKDTWGYSR
ncbi:MAG: phosphate/phosphite/phosphonate ABC transporter substrate-binding protein [Sulfuricaulis sp.]